MSSSCLHSQGLGVDGRPNNFRGGKLLALPEMINWVSNKKLVPAAHSPRPNPETVAKRHRCHRPHVKE